MQHSLAGSREMSHYRRSVAHRLATVTLAPARTVQLREHIGSCLVSIVFKAGMMFMSLKECLSAHALHTRSRATLTDTYIMPALNMIGMTAYVLLILLYSANPVNRLNTFLASW